MSDYNTLLSRVSVVAIVLSALVTPGIDAAGAPGSPPALTADFAETSIRMIYDRFAQQTRDSGNEVTVSLSGFQTIWPEEFDDYYYFVDLVTPPGGWTLRAGLTYFVEPGNLNRFDDALGMHLDPAWFDEFEWLPTQPPAIRDGTLKDLVDLYERERPKEPRAVAYTTYTVEISYAGRTRSYQAAMKWFEATEDERSGNLQDHVMPDLLIVVGEDLEVMREHPALSLPLEGESSPASSCVPLDTTYTIDDPPVLPIGSSVEHQSGRHEARSFNKFRCTCDSGCVSRCTHSHYLPPICQDYGALIGSVGCHRAHYAVRSAPTGSNNQGATCSGAMACYVESCPLNCQCNGLTITISLVLGQLQISVQGNSLWGFESTPSWECPDCQLVNVPPFPGEPDIPCHDPVPELHFQPVTGGVLPGGESLFSNFPLERVEYVGGRPYVMEEWAILVVERDADGALASVEVPTASSSAYAAHQRDSLVNNLSANAGTSSPPSRGDVAERSVLFVLHHPNHPHNERWIPRPRARLGERPVLFMRAPERAVVRADFAEDRTLSALDVLYSDRTLTEEELAFIESHLTLAYANDDRHRVVLYGVVRLDGETIGPESRGRTIDLESYMPVPSMCCCPSDWPNCISGGP